MPFRFLSKTATADIAFEASGKTLNELFESACLATSSVMADLKTVKPRQARSFTKENKVLDGLLYDVLDELVYLKDTDNLLFSWFDIAVTTGNPNKAIVKAKGAKIDQKTMALNSDVKAVTWHLFGIKKTQHGWKSQVLLDV